MQSTTTRVSPETLLAALNYVHRVGKARIGTLSEALGKGKGTAKTALRQLLDEGRLDKIGHWYFPKSGIKSGIIRVGPTPEVQCGDSQQSGIKSGIKSGIISVSDQNRASSIYKSNTQRNDTPENPLVGKGSIGESEDLASSEDETTVISIVSAARLERGGQRDNNLESYRCDVAGIISMLQAIIKERRSGNRKLAQQLTADKVSKSDPRWKMQPYKHLGVYERDLSDALASGTIDYATLRRVLMSISKEIPNWPAKLWGEEAY